MSVLWLESGHTLKYSPWKFPRAQAIFHHRFLLLSQHRYNSGYLQQIGQQLKLGHGPLICFAGGENEPVCKYLSHPSLPPSETEHRCLLLYSCLLLGWLGANIQYLTPASPTFWTLKMLFLLSWLLLASSLSALSVSSPSQQELEALLTLSRSHNG